MWLALAGAIGVEVCATLSLRASDGLRKRAWIAPVILGYLISFVLLWLTLRLGMPVGIAYGVWSACGVALVAVAARVLFGEPLTPLMAAGIALIIGGVLTIDPLWTTTPDATTMMTIGGASSLATNPSTMLARANVSIGRTTTALSIIWSITLPYT